LEEVFEFNERLQAFREESEGGRRRELAAELEADRRRFEEKASALRSRLDDLFGRWDAGEDPGEIVEALRSLLSQRKYIQNAVRDISEALRCPTSA
ncbi:MAG: hypothetical protein ACE5IM_11745, partial [Nitrospinota bacterium]